jgi:hypothetical protein
MCRVRMTEALKSEIPGRGRNPNAEFCLYSSISTKMVNAPLFALASVTNFDAQWLKMRHAQSNVFNKCE